VVEFPLLHCYPVCGLLSNKQDSILRILWLCVYYITHFYLEHFGDARKRFISFMGMFTSGFRALRLRRLMFFSDEWALFLLLTEFVRTTPPAFGNEFTLLRSFAPGLLFDTGDGVSLLGRMFAIVSGDGLLLSPFRFVSLEHLNLLLK